MGAERSTDAADADAFGSDAATDAARADAAGADASRPDGSRWANATAAAAARADAAAERGSKVRWRTDAGAAATAPAAARATTVSAAGRLPVRWKRWRHPWPHRTRSERPGGFSSRSDAARVSEKSRYISFLLSQS